MVADRNEEIQRNLAAFRAKLPTLESHSGKFALIRNEEIVSFFDTAQDAITAGNGQFKDGIFSIQQVIKQGVNLGFYSHALHKKSA